MVVSRFSASAPNSNVEGDGWVLSTKLVDSCGGNGEATDHSLFLVAGPLPAAAVACCRCRRRRLFKTSSRHLRLSSGRGRYVLHIQRGASPFPGVGEPPTDPPLMDQ
ncbi:hypothetical protein E2C01_044826 [Portunus trituberculatus]|uniref:Uncharacterized protein n=1 Tax=Portunus trituberculatus TaxID=210409 RepID=A0A5B7G1I4_PORTR|nr:hypothetical protein [Portunus trituberculatus]